ncbi:MAG: hydrogenase nickel incorporation protein HypB [Psychromonas sp.]|jgi:hydrogenase nickel incorporation protein HypB|uniref:hydrogenase nickel incorporation protein HypB n=1 Tax=Psychromonas sp. TaxID=1884585 RepID=UPI0039E682A7
MCTSCGCDDGETRVDGAPVSELSHSHSPALEPHSHAPELTQKRTVQIEQSLLLKNDLYAQKNRDQFAQQNILALNILSSPGSGKTTLLTTSLNALKNRVSLAVIVGDQATANDALRIRKTGVKAVQVNTGKGCHLDALMVNHALQNLTFAEQGLLFIENVGNLVCPAIFDLGEADKVVILSVTEGEDKPLKYPDMFHAANLLLLNKVDLLPYLDFDLQLCIKNAQKINPNIKIITCSATTGEGMQAWYQWLEQRRVHLLKERLIPLNNKIATINKILPQALFSEGDKE